MEIIKQNSTVTQNGSQRIACLDYARIFVAFLVIYGHLYSYNPENYMRVFIYQFHMPFFFLISGMLHKYNGEIQWGKYVKSLLVPVLFFQILFIAYESVMIHWGIFSDSIGITGDNNLETSWLYIKYGLPKIIQGTFLYCGPCWFIIALFYCKVFYDFFTKHIRWAIPTYILLFITLCYYRHRFLFVSNFVMAMPFYVLGTYLKKQIVFLESWKYRPVLIFASLVIVLLCMYINGSVSSWAIVFGHSPYKPLSVLLFYLTGCVGSLMVLTCCSYFQKSNKVSEFLGNSLISIVGFQNLFVYFVRESCGGDKGYFISIFIALAIFVGCLILHVLTLKVAPSVLGKYKK